MEKLSFENQSYQKHAEHFRMYARGGERSDGTNSWFEKGTLLEESVNNRHKISDPILEYFPGSSWITIGDGRFGSDANYLISKGASALATDISEFLLKEGKEMNYIKDYAVVNAEQIQYPDGSFDFALCKEAYHHFPRPMKALYEMLRISRKGVILLEPVDQYIYGSIFQLLFRKMIAILNSIGVIKLLSGRQIQKHTYEEVGNYVYKISIRELEKVALGLSYQILAYKPVSMVPLTGLEKVKVHQRNKIWFRYRLLTAMQTFLAACKLIEPALLSVIILKIEPEELLIKTLKKHKYKVILLPKAPQCENK
jgi:ubiquinone/menaquinone biosynthesis C-methylase UbiE